MLGHVWTWSEFYSFLRTQTVDQSSSTHVSSISSSSSSSNSVAEVNWYYVTVKNPDFGFGDIFRHIYHDKVEDASRTVNLSYVIQSVTAPMVMAGPPGMVARLVISLWGTIHIGHLLNMYDLFTDLYDIYTTKEIGGKSLVGKSYREGPPKSSLT